MFTESSIERFERVKQEILVIENYIEPRLKTNKGPAIRMTILEQARVLEELLKEVCTKDKNRVSLEDCVLKQFSWNDKRQKKQITRALAEVYDRIAFLEKCYENNRPEAENEEQSETGKLARFLSTVIAEKQQYKDKGQQVSIELVKQSARYISILIEHEGVLKEVEGILADIIKEPGEQANKLIESAYEVMIQALCKEIK